MEPQVGFWKVVEIAAPLIGLLFTLKIQAAISDLKSQMAEIRNQDRQNMQEWVEHRFVRKPDWIQS